ncbi:MAG TPA: AAA family ATPase [Iamia sp.]
MGRADEVRRLVSGVASPDRGSAFLVSGPAGYGKTRLAHEVAMRAAEGDLAVAWGRATSRSTATAFRPVSQLLLDVYRADPDLERSDIGGYRHHLARLLPDEGGTQGPDPSSTSDPSPLLVGEALLRLLRRSGSRWLLVIEDVQWADPETIDVVEYIARAVPRERCSIVATLRTEGDGRAEEIRRLVPFDEEVDVSMLDAASLRDLVSRHLRPMPAVDLDAVAAFVVAHADGSPLLAEELISGLRACGALRLADGSWTFSLPAVPVVPTSLRESVRQRLAELSDPAQRVLAGAAMLGRRFEWSLLPGIVGLDPHDVVSALASATDQGLLDPDGSGHRFHHALTRDAVLAERTADERRALAGRALTAIQRAHPALADDWCDAAAELAEMTGQSALAVELLRTSGARSHKRAAFASAERSFRHAMTLASGPAHASAVRDLVGVLIDAGRPHLALDVDVRLALAEATPERELEIRLLRARAGLDAGALDLCAEELAASAGLSATATSALQAQALRARLLLEQGDIGAARAQADDICVATAETGPFDLWCDAQTVKARSIQDLVTQDAELALVEGVAEREGVTTWLRRARRERAVLGAVLGDTAMLEAERADAVDAGATFDAAVLDLLAADLYLGDMDEEGCRRCATRSIEVADRFDLGFRPVVRMWLAGACALAGDEAAMELHLADATALAGDDPRVQGDSLGRVRATLAVVDDDMAAARRHLDASLPYAEEAPTTASLFVGRGLRAVMAACDDDDRGASAREELEGLPHVMGAPVMRALVEWSAAVGLGRDGRGADAADAFEATVTSLSPANAGWGMLQVARLLVAEAAARDGWGDPVRLSREAEAFFTARELTGLARRARRALRALGAPVPRRGRGRSVVPRHLRSLGFTSREVDVLQQIAAGLTSRQVADELGISVRTVEHHIASMFARTGVNDRHALVAATAPDR